MAEDEPRQTATLSMGSLLAKPHPLLLLGLGVFAAMTLLVLSSPLPVLLDAYLHDDSFYYLKIAENLASGQGSTFDGINYTNGYQPAWLGILTAMFAVGVDHDQMVTTAIAVQALLFALGTVVLWLALIKNGVTAMAAAAGVSIVYFVVVPVLGWDLLEGGLNVLTSAGVLLAFGQLTGPGIAPFWLGLALSLAGLARTDHLFYLPIGGALLFWQIRNDDQPGKLSRALAFLLPIGFIVGGYLAFNLVTTGHIMPVSGLVKRFWAEAYTLKDSLLSLLELDIRQSWKIGLVVALALVIRDASRRRISGLGAYSAGALVIFSYYVFNISYPGGAFWHHVPLYAVFCFGVSAVLGTVVTMVFREWRRTAAAAVATVVIILLAMRVSTVIGYLDRPEAERAEIYRVALALRELTAGSHARVGAWDSGILGYYAGPVTNLDGLVNSVDYFERYVVLDRMTEYVQEHAFDYIVCYESYVAPAGFASGIRDSYVPVFNRYRWVILKRLPNEPPVAE